MSNQTSDLPTLVQSIQKHFSSNLYTSLPILLSRAKLLLSTQNLLTPSPETTPSQAALVRTVFEIGAYTSIRLKDKSSFVNYIGYLQNFYSLGLGDENESELTGLNLLRLLAENKIAEFHTQLEIIDITSKNVATSDPVKFARGLEEWVMEGAYNRVWKAGESLSVNAYQKFFLDVLMDTIRYYSLQNGVDMIETRLRRVWNGRILRCQFPILRYYCFFHRRITLDFVLLHRMYGLKGSLIVAEMVRFEFRGDVSSYACCVGGIHCG